MKVKRLQTLVVLAAVALGGIMLYSYLKPSFDTNKEPQLLQTITGDGSNHLKEPTFAATDEKGFVFISDSGNHRVRVFDKNGVFKNDIGGPDSQKPLVYPYGLGLLDKDRVIIADTGAGALYEYTALGDYVKTWLGAEAKAQPAGVYVDQDLNVYVTDLAGKQVLVFSKSGQLLRKIQAKRVEMGVPLGVVVNKDGTIWVADGGNVNIKLLADDGQVKTTFDGGPQNVLSTPKGLALDDQGRIYVSDTMSNLVRVFDNQGNALFSIGKDQKTKLLLPNGLHIDSQARIYIANQGGNQIQVWGWKR